MGARDYGAKLVCMKYLTPAGKKALLQWLPAYVGPIEGQKNKKGIQLIHIVEHPTAQTGHLH